MGETFSPMVSLSVFVRQIQSVIQQKKKIQSLKTSQKNFSAIHTACQLIVYQAFFSLSISFVL